VTIAIGVVGAGAVSQACHIANFVETEGCRVVALAELRPHLGRAAAAKFGIPRVYESHRALLEDASIDAVVVVTRPAATGAIVLDALRSGRHVLSEKPMAHTVEQAQILAAEASRRGLCYAIGFMKRHDLGVQHARSLLRSFLASGDLGAPAFVRAYCFTGPDGRDGSGFVMTPEERTAGLETWPTAPDWIPEDLRDQYALFLNVNSHDLNLLRHLFDREPIVTNADLSRPLGSQIGFDFGHCTGVFEFGYTTLPDWREGIEVYFESGMMRVTLPAPFTRDVARVEVMTKGETLRPAFEPSWSFRRQAQAFVRDVQSGAAPLAPGSDAAIDLELAENVWKKHLGLPQLEKRLALS
jgi:predicted dehydrogenase